ncbi:MAG: HRDC domain-containing protein [Rickettsiales bacterium]|jgi:ribonuclease D|nr:HRDC domain-containing protein [Rickettsiales bacterium]
MTYVRDSASLKELCLTLKRNSIDRIGIDTEFIRKRTYYPSLCLIQIIYREDVKDGTYRKFAVDILDKNMDVTPLLSILKSKKIKKIMHSGEQDIDALQFFGRMDVNNIEDTQIMAEFCGYRSNMGYAAAVKAILNIDFTKNKSAQISNWEKRPLTKKQLEYAYGDVEYLLELYDVLYRKIKDCGNYDFYRNEIRYVQQSRRPEQLAANSWKKLKPKIHGKYVSYVLLIKNLTSWREVKAIENNKPRNQILRDESIRNIARIKPKTIAELRNIYKNNREILNIKKSYKNDIVEIVSKFVCQDKYVNQLYYVSEKQFIHRDILDYLYSKIYKISTDTHININRILNKMDIISLMMDYEAMENIVYGWKHKLLKDILPEFGNLYKIPQTFAVE